MLPDFRLETHFARWEFRARWNLAASDMETWTLSELLELANDADRAAWHDLRLGYIPTNGTPELREAIAGTYASVTADDVLCFAGAQEGIYCAMHALLAPSDHAIVLVPNYQSLEEIPRSLCTVTGVALDPGAGWHFDVDAVRAALRPNTRLIAVNFPNNPTGRLIPVEDFRALLSLAEQHGVWLFADEVYRGLERQPARQLPQAADAGDRTMSLGVTSKSLGLAGLRVGWIACRDRRLLERMEKVKHYLSIANAGPSELLATIALTARDRILERNREIVSRNLVALREFFARQAERFEWYLPEGGCVGFFRYLGKDGVESFCRLAVEESGVLMLPASVFQSNLLPVPTDRFRLGFGRRDLPQALAALEEHLLTRDGNARLRTEKD